MGLLNFGTTLLSEKQSLTVDLSFPNFGFLTGHVVLDLRISSVVFHHVSRAG